ncbi:type VII secretion target [Micromonospora sp. NPDC005197]|uniref:type VII secretion target n=1 Tax=Micromonospora sp. NPDC005197 TaxID=3157020 RepID=UPI0033A96D19
MPAGDGIQVDPDDLTAHAARLDRCASSLDTAQQAGQNVRLGGVAYGQLCAMLPMLLDGLQRTLVDGIGSAAGSVRDTAGRLRTGADRYRHSDAHAKHQLDGVRQRP